MTDKLTKLLLGKVEEVIAELKELLKSLSQGKKELQVLLRRLHGS